MKKLPFCLLSVLLLGARPACSPEEPGEPAARVYSMGFAGAEIAPPENSDHPVYLSGYHGGWTPEGVLDNQRAQAVWIDDGVSSLLLISVDCIGLGRRAVSAIRAGLADFCAETGCDAVNVVSTHTHAGLDTMGLWGPMGIDGKNPDFDRAVLEAAVAVGKAAYAARRPGTLGYAVTPTEGLQRDSRDPQVYDSNLYQFRFVPDDPAANAIRLVSFAAHAESLRGANKLVSRDYPGVMSDLIKAETGDDVLFFQGAIGGLIMTKEFVADPFVAEENLRVTGRKLTDLALSATEFRPLEPRIAMSRVEFSVRLDNTLFKYYKFLGILQSDIRISPLGVYRLRTETGLLRLGDVTLGLIPGELFPELVFGTGSDKDPAPLAELARANGVENLVVVGLANDEIGYIVPPSDFLLSTEAPFFKSAETGRHYEETNSVGIDAARAVARAFEKALKKLASD
ncbi:MAG: hypothetical protein IJL69_04840 [Oscillospiraceae bacterium]|nr:hypothetical protein [Oscillospiraceae bacterium]